MHQADGKSEEVLVWKGGLPPHPLSSSMRLTPSRTFRDKTDDEDIMATLIDIVEELGKDLDRLQYAGKTITVKYKVCYLAPSVDKKKSDLVSIVT